MEEVELLHTDNNIIRLHAGSTDRVRDRKSTLKHKYHNLVAFVNTKSGGQQGQKILRKLKKHLPERNVYDLSEGPEKGLREHIPKTKKLIVIACGGDGTVCWILSTLDKLSMGYPPVAVLPLGTGNDLARVLRFGGGYNGEDLETILEKIKYGTSVPLDRWHLHVVYHKPPPRPNLPPPPIPAIRNPTLLLSNQSPHPQPFHPLRLNSVPVQSIPVVDTKLNQTFDSLNISPRFISGSPPKSKIRYTPVIPLEDYIDRPRNNLYLPEKDIDKPKNTITLSKEIDITETAEDIEVNTVYTLPSDELSLMESQPVKEHKQTSNNMAPVRPSRPPPAYPLSRSTRKRPTVAPPLILPKKSRDRMLTRSSSCVDLYSSSRNSESDLKLEDLLPEPLLSAREEKPKDEIKVINNYFSIGIDSKIALDFHNLRNSNPNLFQSKFINYMWYGGIGFKNFFLQAVDLSENLELEIDGEAVQFPKNKRIEALVFLNIPSIYGGTNLLEENKKVIVKQYINDEKIEVFAIKNSTHLAMLKTPGQVVPAKFLGQGKDIEVFTKRGLPAQIDGEPFLLPPSRLTLGHYNQANVIYNKHNDKNKIDRILKSQDVDDYF